MCGSETDRNGSEFPQCGQQGEVLRDRGRPFAVVVVDLGRVGVEGFVAGVAVLVVVLFGGWVFIVRGVGGSVMVITFDMIARPLTMQCVYAGGLAVLRALLISPFGP